MALGQERPGKDAPGGRVGKRRAGSGWLHDCVAPGAGPGSSKLPIGITLGFSFLEIRFQRLSSILSFEDLSWDARSIFPGSGLDFGHNSDNCFSSQAAFGWCWELWFHHLPVRQGSDIPELLFPGGIAQAARIAQLPWHRWGSPG